MFRTCIDSFLHMCLNWCLFNMEKYTTEYNNRMVLVYVKGFTNNGSYVQQHGAILKTIKDD